MSSKLVLSGISGIIVFILLITLFLLKKILVIINRIMDVSLNMAFAPALALTLAEMMMFFEYSLKQKEKVVNFV